MMTDSTTQGLLMGETCREYHSNPSMPEHGDLASASHGGGLWLIDNLLTLRPGQPGIPERDLWAGSAAPPGTYAVPVTVDDRVADTQVEVRCNPWITDVTDEDLVAQYEFGMRIRDRVDAANRAVIAIGGVPAQLDGRFEKADDDETLSAAAARLRTAVSAPIYQVRHRSTQDLAELTDQGEQSAGQRVGGGWGWGDGVVTTPYGVGKLLEGEAALTGSTLGV